MDILQPQRAVLRGAQGEAHVLYRPVGGLPRGRGGVRGAAEGVARGARARRRLPVHGIPGPVQRGALRAAGAHHRGSHGAREADADEGVLHEGGPAGVQALADVARDHRRELRGDLRDVDRGLLPRAVGGVVLGHGHHERLPPLCHVHGCGAQEDSHGVHNAQPHGHLPRVLRLGVQAGQAVLQLHPVDEAEAQGYGLPSRQL
mmetsp:Transcript_17515/g.59876  ORF Transcript_17515/g.59876 Transcript_17515/m.59876 type:complete len:203 (-) Transcript_17515:913-1521(-)